MPRHSLYKVALLAAFGVPSDRRRHHHQAGARQRRLGGENPLGPWTRSSPWTYWPIPKIALMAVCMAWMIRWKPRYVFPFVALMAIVVANNAVWAYS